MNVTLAESSCAAGIRALLYQWVGEHVDPVQQTRQTPSRFNVQMIHRSTAIAMEREKGLRLWCVFIADLDCPVYWRSIEKGLLLGAVESWPCDTLAPPVSWVSYGSLRQATVAEYACARVG
jgi:hypothetical protein